MELHRSQLCGIRDIWLRGPDFIGQSFCESRVLTELGLRGHFQPFLMLAKILYLQGALFLDLNSNVILNVCQSFLENLPLFLAVIHLPCSMLFSPKGVNWGEMSSNSIPLHSKYLGLEISDLISGRVRQGPHKEKGMSKLIECPLEFWCSFKPVLIWEHDFPEVGGCVPTFTQYHYDKSEWVFWYLA